MSGGSYNYLCTAYQVGKLEERREDIEAMHRRLTELGYHCAAQATQDVLTQLDRLYTMADRLYDAWHAVEWRDSGDYGDDTLREAMAEWETKACTVASHLKAGTE
jgi:hypothetical protein